MTNSHPAVQNLNARSSSNDESGRSYPQSVELLDSPVLCSWSWYRIAGYDPGTDLYVSGEYAIMACGDVVSQECGDVPKGSREYNAVKNLLAA